MTVVILMAMATVKELVVAQTKKPNNFIFVGLKFEVRVSICEVVVAVQLSTESLGLAVSPSN